MLERQQGWVARGLTSLWRGQRRSRNDRHRPQSEFLYALRNVPMIGATRSQRAIRHWDRAGVRSPGSSPPSPPAVGHQAADENHFGQFTF